MEDILMAEGYHDCLRMAGLKLVGTPFHLERQRQTPVPGAALEPGGSGDVRWRQPPGSHPQRRVRCRLEPESPGLG